MQLKVCLTDTDIILFRMSWLSKDPLPFACLGSHEAE